MMKLSRLWNADATVDGEGRSPLAVRILQSWAHDAGSARFFRSSANFLYLFRHEGTSYFLRFADYSERRREAIEAEVDLLNWLTRAGIRVAVPVPSTRGNLVETTETAWGIFHAVVFPALRGAQFDIDELDPAGFRRWGGALGMLHAALKEYATPSAGARRTWRDDLALACNHLPVGLPALSREWQEIAAALDTLPLDRDHYGLIHFDFELDNLVWDDQRIGIVDFDDCAHYWYAADIAFALRDLSPRGPALDDASFREFIAGYKAHTPLDEESLGAVPLFSRLANLLQYARLARSLDLPRDGRYPDWLEALRSKLEKRMASILLLLEMDHAAEEEVYLMDKMHDMENREEPKEESGMPGGGEGRVDKVGGSSVYPVSEWRDAPADAEVHDLASWGQGERGTEGYDDHGSSEVVHIPPRDVEDDE